MSVTAVEEDVLEDWIVSYLEDDSTLMGMCNGEVQPQVIEPRAASPFVRVDRLDGEDLMVVGLKRVWVNTTWHIRGCLLWNGSGRPDRTEINAIGARLDALLHDHEATTGTYSIHSFREEPEPLPAVLTDGELWLQSGGVYRIRVAAL